MTKGQIAKQNYENSFNCAQSVFAAFAEDYGLTVDLAKKLASCFGGGMRMAGICGALTGAMMALGLAKGCTEPTEENKIKMDTMTVELISRWKNEFEVVDCKELLGYNIMIPEERAQAVETGTIPNVCANLIERGADIVDQLIKELD